MNTRLDRLELKKFSLQHRLRKLELRKFAGGNEPGHPFWGNQWTGDGGGGSGGARGPTKVVADWNDDVGAISGFRKVLAPHGLLLQSHNLGYSDFIITLGKTKVSASQVRKALDPDVNGPLPKGTVVVIGKNIAEFLPGLQKAARAHGVSIKAAPEARGSSTYLWDVKKV